MAEIVPDNERHRVVMTCIVYRDDGKFLVAKRAPHKKVHPNRWTVPGGGLEPSDYIDTPRTVGDAWYYVVERTVRREVMEEVGIEIEKPTYLLDLVFIRPDNVPVLVLSYYAQYKTGEVSLSDDDIIEHRWITPEEGKELDLIEGILEEIEMVDEILKGNPNPVFKP